MVEPLRPRLRAVASRQRGLFTWRQACVEYTPAQVRARVYSRRWQRVLEGVYATASVVVDAATRLVAVRLLLGVDVVGCLATAAAVHGFGVVDDGLVHVARPPGRSGRGAPGVRVHRRPLAGCDLERVAGVLVTTAALTAADLARLLPRLDGIAVLDAALGTGATDERSIAEALDHCGRARGVRTARALLAQADRGAESPMESRLRLRVLDAGLPRPVTQHWVGGFRLDLAWPELRVAAEYDGAVHDGRAATRADRSRHNALRALGWQVFVFTDVEVYRRPGRIDDVLRPALAGQLTSRATATGLRSTGGGRGRR
jgi:very-short-patch-repair endonuclease